MYAQYQDSRDRMFVDHDFISFKERQRPASTARLYMGFSNSPYATFSLWHQPRLFMPAGLGVEPQSLLGTQNMAISSMGIQGIYFVQQYFRPDIPWNVEQRRVIELGSMATVEATPAQQIWPPSSKPVRWPPPLTSPSQFESARLALHRVLAGLPVAVELADSLD